jgi:hypothetical protein
MKASNKATLKNSIAVAPKLGRWFQDKTVNHLYLTVQVSYTAKREIRSVKCVFYRDLKYAGLVTFTWSEFKKLKPAVKSKIGYLQPLSVSTYLEMGTTLKSVR